MGAEPYVWSSGDTALYLGPGEQLTWSRFALAPGAMGRLMGLNDYKDTPFILLWNEIGPVGYGHLSGRVWIP